MMEKSEVLLSAVVLLLGTFADAADNHCGVCHPREKVEFENSIHRIELVACSDCHGGDPASTESDRAHRGSFLSLKDRRTIPDSCAGCHADPSKMRPYNLPADQKLLYDTSHHGKLLARGDVNAAVCSDCHGSHRILPPEDPASPVSPENVPRTCSRCHADAGMIKQYGLDPSIPERFETGVHGRELLGKGNDSAPDCARCHGAHGAAPPGVGDINKVCGSCHSRERWAFVAGPHYEAFADVGLPECASCHGNHDVRGFEIDGAESLCLECHEVESKPLALSRRMCVAIEAARIEVEKATELIDRAAKIPIDVEDYLARVVDARAVLSDLPVVMHSSLADPVESLALRARSIGEEVQHDIYAKFSQRTAWRIVLVAVWFYVLMTVAILAVYKARLGAGRDGR